MTLNIESYYTVSGVQYVIISSYRLHIGHNRTDIQRLVVDNILYTKLSVVIIYNTVVSRYVLY